MGSQMPTPPFPPPKTRIPLVFVNSYPLNCKQSPAMFPQLTPHLNTQMSTSPSITFLWYSKSSLTFLTPFNWSNAISIIKGYTPFFNKQTRPCPFCPCGHRLDHISSITYCSVPFGAELHKQILDTWAAQLQHTIKQIVSSITGRPLSRLPGSAPA